MTILIPDRVRTAHLSLSTNPSFHLIPASAFTYEELTEAYNQTRVDYIVPMPMNAARLREYVETYDVDMDASAVAVEDDHMLALGMLGVREGRAWITRLGVVRSNRRQGVGWTLVTHLVEQACQKKAAYIVIEVIDDNLPAYSLFSKKGFKPVRELLVLRRPPANVKITPPAAKIETLSYAEAVQLLQKRAAKASWIDEYESLLNAGNLSAFRATLTDGSEGWLVYQNTVFQLSRLVMQTEVGSQLNIGRALLHYLHTVHPVQDTKTENLPANDPHWPAFKELGYLVSFRRVEMVLPLK
ncbi:MAG: GNAT family N-acetyltransferase [Anaerolineae bacterium]|nr:GNAT family N-acetyltransferase [Anaerolineae bacterium]